jgi:hypothetical protein
MVGAYLNNSKGGLMINWYRRTSEKFKVRHLKWLLIFIIQLALQGCALGGQTMVFHSFNFDTLEDSPGIEVLDYQYGGHNKEYDDSGQVGVRAEKERVALGEVFNAQLTSGVMPRAAFLYVKWRIKESGQVYEDRVDLTTRLPADITHCGIHFVVKGPQLYVYLIPPPGIFPPLAIRRAATDEKMAAYLKEHQIYPDQSK